MTRTLSLPVAGIAALLATAPALFAQGQIHQWVGDTRYQFFGTSVSNIGDVNGDGYDDVVIGGPGDDTFGQDAGIARCFSGFDGNQLWAWNGAAPADELGHWVSGAGDCNGDGTPDLIICSPRHDANGNQGSGRVRVYAGGTWSLLHTFDGQAAKDFFGWSATDLGDVDGDGFDDVAIGAWQYDPGIQPGSGIGYVDVYSGWTGQLLYRFNGPQNTGFFGHSVGGPGDVNQDGHADILVGSHGNSTNGSKAGRVFLFSGADGSTLYTWDGDAAGDHLGYSVHGAGDVNGDGVPDIIAGARHDDTAANNAGMARVYSGADGSTLYTWYGSNADDLFGMSVSGGGDLNGDGFDDPIVGIRHDDSYGDNSGAARAYSGADGSEMWTAYGYAGDEVYGFSVSHGGDINGDGFDDVLVGATQYNNGPGLGNGYAQALDPTQAPPPPPLDWPNLPTTYVAIGSGWSEGFESYAGSPPTHFGINALDAVTRDDDPNAWCNIGQNGGCTGGNSGVGPRTGSYDLELGGVPGFSGNYTVANGLVIGLDGSGHSALTLDFWVYNFGEEPDNDDGVWVSADGTDWERVVGGWSGRPQGQWTHISGIDLASTSVDVSGEFLLLFAQTDNLEIGTDGVLFDDIEIMPAQSGYRLTMVTPGTAGTTNVIEGEGGTPGANSTIAYDFRLGSYALPGCGISVDLKFPKVIGTATADANGHFELGTPVPPKASGVTAHLQSVELSTCQKSNVLTVTFQ